MGKIIDIWTTRSLIESYGYVITAPLQWHNDQHGTIPWMGFAIEYKDDGKALVELLKSMQIGHMYSWDNNLFIGCGTTVEEVNAVLAEEYEV